MKKMGGDEGAKQGGDPYTWLAAGENPPPPLRLLLPATPTGELGTTMCGLKPAAFTGEPI